MRLTLATAVAVLLALAGPAAADRDVFALIVTNNHSADLGRPNLQFADDDGAKYYEMFSMFAPADHLALLTDFDADTARLFSELVPLSVEPTTGNLAKASAALEKQIAKSIAAGNEVHFYFVFAGHGDVDRGRGFLELADGPFDSGDLEKLLSGVSATRSHVILDSCNSFFVINPRKAGGRRFSTAKDAAAKLTRKLPDVGVFLSTSAEAEVYEWSELQSGIFSHAVRSGLSGAADANSDGVVSYAELEAFVQLSASRVRNPLFRPKVFSRAPGGKNDSALVRLPGDSATSIRIDDDSARRITVRDADELRWIDTFKEAGAAATLFLPARVAARLRIDELEERGGTYVVSRRFETEGAEGTVSLTSLEASPNRTSTRGPSDLLRALFAVPFGPRAVQAFESERSAEIEPVFGITRDDGHRMELLLEHTAGLDRQEKFAKAGILIGASTLAVLGGAYTIGTAEEQKFASVRTQRAAGWAFALGGGLGIAGGVVLMFRESHGESAYRHFVREIDDPDVSAAQAVANAEDRLLRLQREESNLRLFGEVLGWSGAGASVLALAGNELFGPAEYRDELRVLFGGGLVAGVAGALILRSNITPVERMIDIWHDDPGIQRLPRLSVQPIEGGALLHYGGAF